MTSIDPRPTLFDGLDAADVQEILRLLPVRRVPPGDEVVVEGDNPSAMYLIESGTADVLKADSRGGEHLVTRIGPGGLIGEMSVITGQPTSATVRAGSELHLWTISQDRFQQITARYPRLYQNVAVILSEKLARTDLQVVQAGDRATLLIDGGAPPLLGYALACSVAWHTRSSVLLLLITEGDAHPELAGLADPHAASLRGPHPLVRDSRARLAVVPPEGDFHPTALPNAIDLLLQAYDRVLVQVAPAFVPPNMRLRSFLLLGEGGQAPEPADLALTVRGWVANPAPAGRGSGVDVPQLGAADNAALEAGMLPPAGPAGIALGWAARHLARLKVGLALGAGGAKGYGHVGVVRALRRLGVPIDYVAGTSIGSCVASMVSTGRDPDEMIALLDDFASSLWRLTIPRVSFLSSRRLMLNFQRTVGDSRIEDLDPPLAIVAADILTQEEVIFREGLLWAAVLASVSIPGIYPPQRMGRHLLVDGGVVNPVPANVAAEMGADVVIAVKLARHAPPSPVHEESRPSSPGGPPVFQTISRTLETMHGRIITATAATATIQINLDFDDVTDPGVRHFKEGRRFVALGEAKTQEAVARLAATLPWLADKM